MIISNEEITMILSGHEIKLNYKDLVWFGKFKFYVSADRGQSLYVKANDKRNNTTVGLHRLIMNPEADLEIDHINRNGLDNRRCNLRIVSHKINQNNLPKKKCATSKYFGVSYVRDRDLWLSQIRINNKTHSLGRFKSELEAANAYNNAIVKFGISTHRFNKL